VFLQIVRFGNLHARTAHVSDNYKRDPLTKRHPLDFHFLPNTKVTVLSDKADATLINIPPKTKNITQTDDLADLQPDTIYGTFITTSHIHITAERL
jgi:hypothetical protein